MSDSKHVCPHRLILTETWMDLRFEEDAPKLRGSYIAEGEHSSLPRDIQGSAIDVTAKGAKICGTQGHVIE